MKEKFAIISGEIHRLVKIKPDDDWSEYPWTIYEDGDWYWVPVPNSYEASEVSKHFGVGSKLNLYQIETIPSAYIMLFPS